MVGPPSEFNRMAVFVFMKEDALWNGKTYLPRKK